jgi:hypothetical protein
VWISFLFAFVIFRTLWPQPSLTPEEKHLHSENHWFMLSLYGWALVFMLAILVFAQLTGIHARLLLSALFLGLWAWAVRQAIADGVWVTAGALCCLAAPLSFVLPVLFGPNFVIVPLCLIFGAMGFFAKHLLEQIQTWEDDRAQGQAAKIAKNKAALPMA